jgi:hypothetical protein
LDKPKTPHLDEHHHHSTSHQDIIEDTMLMSKTQNDIPEHLEATMPKKSQRGLTDTIDTQLASIIKPNLTEEEI